MAAQSPRTVENWAAKTPDNFLFAIKTPRCITHDKLLHELRRRTRRISNHYGNSRARSSDRSCCSSHNLVRRVFADRHAFTDRLIPFLKKLPTTQKIRHRDSQCQNGSTPNLPTCSANAPIALVLPDLPYMPRPEELAQKFDPITANWTYIRWLGDRKGIELQTTTWDKTIVDRTAGTNQLGRFLLPIKRRGITVYAYANNHYAGHGPSTIRQFRDLWRQKSFTPFPEPTPTPLPTSSPSPSPKKSHRPPSRPSSIDRPPFFSFRPAHPKHDFICRAVDLDDAVGNQHATKCKTVIPSAAIRRFCFSTSLLRSCRLAQSRNLSSLLDCDLDFTHLKAKRPRLKIEPRPPHSSQLTLASYGCTVGP